jgi:hypothetical protein
MRSLEISAAPPLPDLHQAEPLEQLRDISAGKSMRKAKRIDYTLLMHTILFV